MTKTTNYQLNQWAKSDRLRMDDFNADNQKIDAALAAKSRVACGVNPGDGTASRTIDLDFTPKAVLVLSAKYLLASTDNTTRYGGLALTGHPVYACDDTRLPVVSVTENGFIVTKESITYFSKNYAANSNTNGDNYLYLAIA